MVGLYRVTDQRACERFDCHIEGLEIRDGVLFLGTPTGFFGVKACLGNVFHANSVELVGKLIEE